MSKASADTALALFDRQNGRGDILSIQLEDGVKLAALPKDMFAEILYPLYQWWVKGIDTPPADPRDRMVYEGLKEHQIQNAVKRGVNLNNWHDASLKAAEKKRLKSTKRNPSGIQAESKWNQNKDIVTDEEQDTSSSSSSVAISAVGGDRRASVAAPVPPLSVNEAKQTLMRFAPAFASYAKGTAKIKLYEVTTRIGELEANPENNDPKTIYTDLPCEYGIPDDEKCFDRLDAVYEQIPAETFKRTIVKYCVDWLMDENEEIKNPAAVLLDRMNRVIAAVATLNKESGKTPADAQ